MGLSTQLTYSTLEMFTLCLYYIFGCCDTRVFCVEANKQGRGGERRYIVGKTQAKSGELRCKDYWRE